LFFFAASEYSFCLSKKSFFIFLFLFLFNSGFLVHIDFSFSNCCLRIFSNFCLCAFSSSSNLFNVCLKLFDFLGLLFFMVFSFFDIVVVAPFEGLFSF
jgi:hypothetical protein